MNEDRVIKQIKDTGVIPVVRATTADEAMRAIDAIREGGNFGTRDHDDCSGAVGVIEQVSLVMETTRWSERARCSMLKRRRPVFSAGAQFVVSPALNLETIACCREQDVAVMPGALTPTEVVQAWNAGADFVKVFPAGAVGGASYLKALKAPLPQIELVPPVACL